MLKKLCPESPAGRGGRRKSSAFEGIWRKTKGGVWPTFLLSYHRVSGLFAAKRMMPLTSLKPNCRMRESRILEMMKFTHIACLLKWHAWCFYCCFGNWWLGWNAALHLNINITNNEENITLFIFLFIFEIWSSHSYFRDTSLTSHNFSTCETYILRSSEKIKERQSFFCLAEDFWGPSLDKQRAARSPFQSFVFPSNT